MKEHWGDTLQPALVQHIELTLIAVVIGFAIAFPLALLAHRYGKLEQPIGAFSALLYTIPSLALFQLLIPFSGLTWTTVEIALVAYTLVILFPNFVAGLKSAPDEVLEAARGMGLTRAQVLRQVELPLAVPAIIGGLRVAVVSTVAIATIAAFLLPDGLGYPIILALKEPTPFKTEIYSAGALAVAFALTLRPVARRAAPGPRTVGGERRRMTFADAANAHTFVDAIQFIGDHPGFLLQKALEQLELSGAALAIAILVALPLGLVLGHFHRGSGIAIGTSIIGRALPSLVLIAAFLTLLGIGFVNNMVALAVLGSGPILTNSYEGIDRVDKDIVESARGMGLTGGQILRRIELPLAIPLLFTGIRIAAVTIVATATIAAVAGGGGLGDVIVNQASYRLSGVIAASLCVMALSALVFLVLAGIQIGVTPKGLRSTSVTADHPRKEQQ